METLQKQAADFCSHGDVVTGYPTRRWANICLSQLGSLELTLTSNSQELLQYPILICLPVSLKIVCLALKYFINRGW